MGLLEIISRFGDIMRKAGINNPTFVMNRDAVRVLMGPNMKLDVPGKWISASHAPGVSKSVSIIGIYDGVILTEVQGHDLRVIKEAPDGN